MKKLLLATVALSAIAGSAVAADLPYRRAAPAPAFVAVPVFTWTGLYLGGNAGYAFAADDTIRTGGNQPLTANNVAAGFRPSSFKNKAEGFTGGGQIGYNYQVGSLVFGLETDINYMDTAKTSDYLSPRGDRASFRTNMDYLGTVRGRIGYAMDRTMFYVTGGLAYGEVYNRASFFNFAPPFNLQFAGAKKDMETGYAVGAGVEYAIPMFSFAGAAATMKLEYMYYDLGHRNITVGNVLGAGTSYNSRFSNDGHIVRAGLNYKFSSFGF